MNNQEKLELEDIIHKIERNMQLLEYVRDAVIDGNGIGDEKAFDGAIYEIALGLREGVEKAKTLFL